METILFRHILNWTEIVDKTTLAVIGIAWDDSLPLDTQISIIDGIYYYKD